MPMYEYQCPVCKTIVTLHHSMTVEQRPVCQRHKGPAKEMKKIISRPQRPIIRGS